MPKLKTRLVTVPLAGIALALAGGLFAATSASAHESPTPVGNVGDAVQYGTHAVQLHLDAPMLGLNPAIDDPYGYVSGHVLGTGVNIVSYTLTGHPIADDHTGEDHDH
ncbi:hypothetical protein EV643_11746 [Kribbella sp. VKM Ac-2527]|uniref:Uncharacterized protein n=1 Tax=Kribbella caucasensis TaxID=2512215 RepID=A0A4R6K3V0_9ACTN|nr:hypothetical protein [Kribbella sp. VKM Ac-2527]TDO44023.1 hypothetical protein EV643_11746 [Kribbella sp. VKM Ac-2527]